MVTPANLPADWRIGWRALALYQDLHLHLHNINIYTTIGPTASLGYRRGQQCFAVDQRCVKHRNRHIARVQQKADLGAP